MLRKSHIIRAIPIAGILIFALLFTGCKKTSTTFDEAHANAEKDSVKAVLKDKSMRNIDSVSRLLTHLPDAWGVPAQIVLHTELGKLYREKSDFVSAVVEHRKAVELAIETKDTMEIIRTYNQLGTDYRRIGSQADAAEAHFQALQAAEAFSLKDTEEGMKLLSYSLNGIGNVYKTLDNGNEAFSYFQRSSELDEKTGNNLGLAMNLSTMGTVLEHQDKLDSAEIYYRKALKYDSLAKSETGIAICHNRLGQLFFKKNQLDDALSNYTVARDILIKRNDTWNKMKTEMDIAKIYIEQNRFQDAHAILKDLETVARERNMYGYLQELYYYLGNLQSKQGKYGLASEAYNHSIVYGDSVQTMQDEQNVMETRVKFEREISERRIDDLNKQNEQEKKQKRLISLGSSIILLLLLGLLITSYYLIRAQRKRNTDLEEANATKDKFFSIVSHDLKNPVIAQRNALQAIVDNIDNFDTGYLANSMYALLQSSESQLELLNNMLDWARVQTGRMSYKPVKFDIRSVVTSAVHLLTPTMEEKNISIESSIAEPTLATADKNMFEIILRNLINNAIKFSHPGGKIKIDLQNHSSNQYLISVTDNGVGLTGEQINNLFRLDKQQSTAGTKGEKGSGLGLIVCKELIEKNNGKMTVSSKPNSETTFSFTLNKA